MALQAIGNGSELEELPHILNDRTRVQKDLDWLKQWGCHQ